MPALCALMSGNTIACGSTRRNRIPKRVRNETRTPENSAVSQSPNGMNWKNTTSDDDGDEDQRQHHAQAEHRFVHGR